MARLQGLPAYFEYYTRPVKFLATPDGGMAAWKLSWDTGGWEPADELVDEIIGAVGGEISPINKDRFVDLTERNRAELLQGEGPVFALYETVNGLLADARERRRPLSDEEKALVKGVRRRTYAMFEAELARRGDPAADVPAEPAG
jgi:hypothetical protein